MGKRVRRERLGTEFENCLVSKYLFFLSLTSVLHPWTNRCTSFTLGPTEVLDSMLGVNLVCFQVIIHPFSFTLLSYSCMRLWNKFARDRCRTSCHGCYALFQLVTWYRRREGWACYLFNHVCGDIPLLSLIYFHLEHTWLWLLSLLGPWC